MTDGKSPAEIEREIEEERSALARSLEELQSQFSPEHIMETATVYLRDHGGDVAQSVGRQIKENPMAAALTGVGLAWLMFGSSKPSSPTYDRWSATHDRKYVGDRAGEVAATAPQVAYDDTEYDRAPGLRRTGRPAMGDFDDRLAQAAEAEDDPSLLDRAQGVAENFSDAMGEAAHAAKLRALEAANALRHGAEDLFDEDDEYRRYDDHAALERRIASGTATSREWDEWQTGVRFRRNRPQQPKTQTRSTGRTYAKSQTLLSRISEGTETMSEAARLRVMRARQRAYEAQQEMEARFGDYSGRAGRVYDRQPLLGGLLAAGVGALIGAALPRTEREDQTFGAYRDRAFDEAERIYHEERAKLRAVADAAMNEAKTMAEETLDDLKSSAPTGQDAVDRAEGAVKSAADRVSSAAKNEAEKQNLGSNLN